MKKHFLWSIVFTMLAALLSPIASAAIVNIPNGLYRQMYGLNADRLALTQIQPYSYFYETDTGSTYQYLGSWVAVTTGGSAVTTTQLPATLGIKNSAGSLSVAPSSDGVWPASQSGTWTVQPGNTANTTAWKVDGSAVTQPVSAASLPLPSGAATVAKQPALGTAGTPSADVITVQGAASMTALKTDSSATTQPVSGTVTANIGTSGSLALEATQSAGNTLTGAVNETAPASDTASSGLNGRAQRIAQNLTTLIAKVPAQGNAASTAAQPVTIAYNTATGSITTQNLVPAGTATAGSAVELTLAGASNYSIQTTGTYTGALSVQTTVDGATWVTDSRSSILLNLNTGVYSTTIASAATSVYNAVGGSVYKVRVTGLSAMTGTAVVTISSAVGSSVTSINAINTLNNGQSSDSAAVSGNPVTVSGAVVTAVDSTLVAGDTARHRMTTGGAHIVWPYAAPEISWNYAAASGGISNTTTAVTIQAAASGIIRNYVKSCDLMAETLGAATEFAVRDGAGGTVLYRTKIGTGGMTGRTISFDPPLRGTAATLVEIVTLTASITGAVYSNCQGFQAP